MTRCIEIGAEDYLPKPFNWSLLRARLASCLGRRARERTEQQRRRYQELLHAILPSLVLTEWVETDAVQPRRREDVAVLFANIVGFTPFCDRHQESPELVVRHLRAMYEAWEEMADSLGVQKIKTIGDIFMAASGLLEYAANPVLDCVRLGLEMIRFARGLRDDDGRSMEFDLRVGIHIGRVVAGVLGRRQSLYDLWGDTVNVAALLESHGRPGSVNLSLEAWARVTGLVRGEDRSVCSLKGKLGPTEVVHLSVDRAELADT